MFAFAAVAAAACGVSDEDGNLPTGSDGGMLEEETDASRPATGEAAVYAHSSNTLYRLNPETLEVQVVGSFSGCSSVIDIALDKDSNIYATTFSGLYEIDSQTAACSLIAFGSYPNSLSFVPAGLLDPNQEVLVAYLGSQYVKIDVDSGQISNIGNIEGGYASSGDVVSVEGGGTFLTATGPGCSDCLLQIDPETGAMINNWGPLGYASVFGLAYWGGTAYGFNDFGAAFSIDFAGSTVITTPIEIPNAPAGLSFWGAGSSTKAPIID
jgi:hypothetical protein